MANLIAEEEVYENFVRLADLSDYVTVLSDGTSDMSTDVKRRGKGKLYCKDTTHDTKAEAISVLESELYPDGSKVWRSKSGHNIEKISKSDTKIYYLCSKPSARGLQCSTGAVLISPLNSTTTETHRTICPHDCISKTLAVC